MGKSDNKSRALGDDPLAWLNAGSETDKKENKKKVSSKKKASKKAKPKKPAKENKVKAEKVAKAEKVEAVEEVESSYQLVLESSLVINKASDFYETLKKITISGQVIEIDASKVEAIDSAILQLLLAFVLKLKKDDVRLSWHKPTDVLLNKASTLGLQVQLGL